MENQYQNRQPDFCVVQNRSVVSVGDLIITFILMAIPIVNIVMLFVWAFGSDTPESKANRVKASLILYLIAIILTVCFRGTIAAILVSILNN
jgi:hypothetical protein